MLLGENILNRKLKILHMSNICCTHYLVSTDPHFKQMHSTSNPSTKRSTFGWRRVFSLLYSVFATSCYLVKRTYILSKFILII